MATHRTGHLGDITPGITSSEDSSIDEKGAAYTTSVDEKHAVPQLSSQDEKETLRKSGAIAPPGLDSLATMNMTMPERTMGMTNTDEIAKVPFISEDLESMKGNTQTAAEKADKMDEIALHILKLDDDPTLNVWTFRVFFIGNNPIAQSKDRS